MITENVRNSSRLKDLIVKLYLRNSSLSLQTAAQNRSLRNVGAIAGVVS